MALAAAGSAGDRATMAPTLRSWLGQPSSRWPMPGANELSTVEWQSAQVMPTLVRVLLASTWPMTPTTAPSLSKVTVVAGSSRLTCPACSAAWTDAGSVSRSTLSPTESAVLGLTLLRITSCRRRVSVQKLSSPYVSKRKTVFPCATSAAFSGPWLTPVRRPLWQSTSTAATAHPNATSAATPIQLDERSFDGIGASAATRQLAHVFLH